MPFSDHELDRRLREVSLPERFLDRMHAALDPSDDVLDQRLCQAAVPYGLAARLRDIPAQEPVDSRLCEVAIPAGLTARLRMNPVAPRRVAPAVNIREFATAAAVLLAVTATFWTTTWLWFGPTFAQFAARRPAEPQGLYAGPLLVEMRTVDSPSLESLAIVAAEPWPVETAGTGEPEIPVALMTDEPLDPAGPVGQWFRSLTLGAQPWANTVHLQWGLLGFHHDDSDDGIRLEPFPRLPPVGVEPPVARGYSRTFWTKHHVFPPMSPAVPELRSLALPLVVDRAGVARLEQLLTSNRKPSAREFRVEELAAAVAGAPAESPAGKVVLTTAGCPSPFGPPNSLIMQVIAQAGPAPVAPAPRHIVIALDLSASMGRRGGWAAGQRALAALLDKLHPEDRLSLVAFNDDVAVLTEQLSAADAVEWRNIVQQLTPQGGADLAVGLREAATLALGDDAGHLKRELLILTDHEAPLPPAVRPALIDLVKTTIAGGVRVQWFDLGAEGQDTQLAAGSAAAGGAEVQSITDGVWGALAAWERKQSPTVGSEVTVRLEFNPKTVAAYRLMGHEAGSWSSLDPAPQPVELRAGQSGLGLIEILPATADSDLGTATLSWRDPASGQVTQTRHKIQRERFASSLQSAPPSLQRMCVAAEAAEVLRGSRDALRDIGWTGRETHDLTNVINIAKGLSVTVRDDPEFARLLQLLDGARRPGR